MSDSTNAISDNTNVMFDSHNGVSDSTNVISDTTYVLSDSTNVMFNGTVVLSLVGNCCQSSDMTFYLAAVTSIQLSLLCINTNICFI